MAKIVFIGDSITKGTDYGGVTSATTFASKVSTANGYAAADIINKGVGGDTSGGVLARLRTDVISYTPDVCCLMIGINDWAKGVTVAQYQSNLSAIFGALIAAGIKPVVISSNMQRGPTADFAAFKPFLLALEAAAKGVCYIDLYREMAAAYLYLPSTDFYALYVDNVHLTAAGHQFVTDMTARPQYAGYFVKP